MDRIRTTKMFVLAVFVLIALADVHAARAIQYPAGNQSYGQSGSLYQPGGPRSLQFMFRVRW